MYVIVLLSNSHIIVKNILKLIDAFTSFALQNFVWLAKKNQRPFWRQLREHTSSNFDDQSLVGLLLIKLSFDFNVYNVKAALMF